MPESGGEKRCCRRVTSCRKDVVVEQPAAEKISSSSNMSRVLFWGVEKRPSFLSLVASNACARFARPAHQSRERNRTQNSVEAVPKNLPGPSRLSMIAQCAAAPCRVEKSGLFRRRETAKVFFLCLVVFTFGTMSEEVWFSKTWR